jgi:hypothetical protein
VMQQLEESHGKRERGLQDVENLKWEASSKILIFNRIFNIGRSNRIRYFRLNPISIRFLDGKKGGRLK